MLTFYLYYSYLLNIRLSLYLELLRLLGNFLDRELRYIIVNIRSYEPAAATSRKLLCFIIDNNDHDRAISLHRRLSYR